MVLLMSTSMRSVRTKVIALLLFQLSMEEDSVGIDQFLSEEEMV
jgi:hypothetical protein